jgi:hypothetical protein
MNIFLIIIAIFIGAFVFDVLFIMSTIRAKNREKDRMQLDAIREISTKGTK